MEAADIWQGWGRPDRHPHLGLLLLSLSFLSFRGWYGISSLWHRLCLPGSHCHGMEMCLYGVISQPCCYSHGSHQGTSLWNGQVSSAHILFAHGQGFLCFPFKNSAEGDFFLCTALGIEIASALCIYQLKNAIILPDQAWCQISAMRNMQSLSSLALKNQSFIIVVEE